MLMSVNNSSLLSCTMLKHLKIEDFLIVNFCIAMVGW